MIQYKQDRFTKHVFRRAQGAPEEYIAINQAWMVTGDAIEAFYDSSDYKTISEQQAKEAIESQNRAVQSKLKHL